MAGVIHHDGIVEFLTGLGLQDYTARFDGDGYDVDTLVAVVSDVADFNTICTDIGMKPGHQRRLKVALERLRHSTAPQQGPCVEPINPHTQLAQPQLQPAAAENLLQSRTQVPHEQVPLQSPQPEVFEFSVTLSEGSLPCAIV